MIKFIYLLVFLIPLIFSACSGKTIAAGASKAEKEKLSVVMVANSDITCKANYTTYYIKKGTAFSIKEIGNLKFKTRSASPFGVSDMLSSFTFPDNALLLPFSSDINQPVDNGLIVYPNGKFVFTDHYGAAYDPTGGNWWLHDGQCQYTSEDPFELKDYR